mmetsp:Transcript_1683/g.3883  ORF Transcript_1683/g.3883 Transcript_1683/m.3883 type:complete len:266 (-) Transcript_1683:304-1101(-)
MAILMPGSAISAVATGTHTPHVTRSTAILDVRLAPSPSLANMPSLALSIGPYMSFTVVATSSSRKNNPAHSPRDPPSSNLPMESLLRSMGMMATRAKADSASGPFLSKARPRRHEEMVRRREFRMRRRRSASSCSVWLLSRRSSSSSFARSSSPSFSSSVRCRTLVSRLSNLPTRHFAVSLSNRRIRGASFIRKRDFSMMTPLIPPPPFAEEDASSSDGGMLLPAAPSSPAALSEEEAASLPPIMVMAETSAVLDWSSWRRWRVV